MYGTKDEKVLFVATIADTLITVTAWLSANILLIQFHNYYHFIP